jgi:uroporphyrinogen decarboxylase
MPPGGSYFDYTEFPLAEPSIEALDAMPWPDPALPARYKGLRERTAALRASTDKALLGMAPGGHDLFNRLLRVRGMDEGLMDLVANRDFAEAFLDRMTDSICTAQRCFLREVGDLIDVHFNGDDLSGQHGPLIAPKTYRELIKPRQMRIMETVKGCTNARIFYHSCGAVGEFIPDILEMGVDILNPVQVSAAGMNTADLKRRYGREISFWGGGCDTQFVLSTGTADEVRNEVRRRIRDLAPGGGYIFNPVHNIQPLVPPENVVAMFDEARTSGQYPLKR